MSIAQWWNDRDTNKWNTWRKTCPSATLSTTNPIWIGLGSNHLGLVVTRFTYTAPGLTQKAWHFVHTATVSLHSIHWLQAQCSMWDMNWILIQKTDISCKVLKLSTCDKHFDRIRMYITHDVLNIKYKNSRQQNYSWWVEIAVSQYCHYTTLNSQLLWPASLLFNGCQGFCYWWQNGWCMKLTPHHHVVLRLGGAIPLLSLYALMVWEHWHLYLYLYLKSDYYVGWSKSFKTDFISPSRY
jgi:hypothetical protein